jgi:hypothetical protein
LLNEEARELALTCVEPGSPMDEQLNRKRPTDAWNKILSPAEKISASGRGGIRVN